MGRNDDRSNLQSKLELIIENNPNTILIVDKDLVVREIVVAKDELSRLLEGFVVGKSPEDVFTDAETLTECVNCKNAIRKAIADNMAINISYAIRYKGKEYHYNSKIQPYKDDLAIVYAQDVSATKELDALNELINTILDRLPLGVFVKDAENKFNYLYWNRFMEEITGIDTANVAGHNDFEINYDAMISPEERVALDRDLIKTGRVAEFQWKVKTVSGISKDIEVIKIPISLSNGKPLLLAMWRDVTAKLAMEEALKRTQSLTQMALYTSDVRTCSIFINPSDPVGFDNMVMQVSSWDTKEEVLMNVDWKQYTQYVHPDDMETYGQSFMRLCRGEVADIKIEFRVKYPDMDAYNWREVYVYRYECDEKGRPTVLLGCSTNIQDRKNQELNLEEAREKAEVADKMKSKYLADMSHEIRTPLNAITGFSELMAFADSDEERMSYYDIIKTNNQLLMQLVNDILDLSKIEADAIKISYAPIDVNELMDTTFASIRLRMPEGVALFLEKGTCSYTFGTDCIRLLQLINNLANNAIKNTKQGSITMGYTCLPDKQLKFYVKDTGIGIARDRLESLFTRFVKVNDYVEGIGLGLAICQGLVSKMGGSISVESELGVGSTFSFILPSHD